MKTLLIALALVIATPVQADTLLIERVQATAGKNLPHMGQSMTQVEKAFGAPQTKHAAVGGGSPHTPPITRWDYAEFAVYFENDHVVNSVLNHANPNELGPKPIQ